MYTAPHLTEGMFHKDNPTVSEVFLSLCVLDLTKNEELDIDYHSGLIRFALVLIWEWSQTNKDGWRLSW